MHQVGLLKVFVRLVDCVRLRAEFPDVVLKVPAGGLIHHVEHQKEALVYVFASQLHRL